MVWRVIAIVAVLALAGCAAQRESYLAQRDAPDLSFKGPVRSVTLSPAQIRLVQKGIAAGLKNNEGSPNFGKSYRGAMNADGQLFVCGYVNGKRFTGMFARPTRGAPQFLPIGVGIDQQEEDAVKLYCRDDGIYLPQ